MKLGLLSPSHLTPLTSLLKPHPPDDRSSAHPGFDWLTAISFLLTRGHRERATPISQLLHVSILLSNLLSILLLSILLSNLLSILLSILLSNLLSILLLSILLSILRSPLEYHWTRSFGGDLPQSGTGPSGIYNITPSHLHTHTSSHTALQGEAPQLTAALQVSGCSVAQVVGHWTRQAFLNYLDWPHLLLYLATTVVMGTNYQVCVQPTSPSPSPSLSAGLLVCVLSPE